MQLKITPTVGARYWVAISIASMCGTNFGDFFPDILKIGTAAAMAILAVLFAALVLIDRASNRGSEAFYWLSILVVRAAATQVADFSIGQAHLSYLLVAAVLAALLAALVVLRHRASGPKAATGDLPPTNGWYWFTMLTAGALGTVMGDGLGHSLGPVSTGVPLSAAMATVALALILIARSRFALASAPSYWVAVVAVRWWGTNTGDIFAFVATLMVSMAVTGVAMALVLLLWKQRPTEREGGAYPLGV